jgi:thiamine biosynthesis protein ThiI
MDDVILAKYGELWLKSDPVKMRFTKKLAENAKEMLKRSGVRRITLQRERDMFTIQAGEKANLKKAGEVLKRVFGISWFSMAKQVVSEQKEIEKAVTFFSKKIKAGETFAVRVDRVDKGFPGKSNELEALLGAKIDREVDLSSPDFTIFVEIRRKHTHVYSEKVRCEGGLPSGVSGKILCMMSGGIDSPAAAWMMMRRGCSPSFIYFSNYPLVPKTDRENVMKIIRKLREYSPGPLTLITVPIVKMQEAVVNSCENRFKCLIGRRIMYRIAEEFARELGAKALLTGDSLAQVASQTLDNICSEDEVLSMPVLKPLIGMDKDEIIRVAKKIGTYETSIKIKTSCPLATKNPATRSEPEKLRGEESRVKDLDRVIKAAIKDAEITRV